MTDTSTRVPPRRPGGLPEGTRVTLDPRVRVHGSVVLGGSPWGVARLAPAALALVARARVDGPGGTVPLSPAERSAADLLVERGVLHPVVAPRPSRVEVVVPAYGRPDLLDACLASLARSAPGGDVLVVDDASPTDEVAAVARAHGARLVRHPVNRGPAAARNTGLAATTGDVVGFVDADVTVPAGWLDGLVPLFDDPRVGAVAPRVLPRSRSRTLLARHELARSALDMGARRELVRHGSPLGFLPSATLLVRRSALADAARGGGAPGAGFDEEMRVGEDVDLVWRLLGAGWHVRYEPAVEVHHEMRVVPGQWARRRYEYGTSAAALDDRHPGRLAPA
ncbi:MAG: mycofactocin biosynthesis glycosyltransferase MftF, partial [Actinobacteria bacterium]|nr:mycofactocin biosynthesis glycosyltransferase MftF [Actinomycetota bacterium]